LKNTIHRRGTENTEKIIILPNRETTIGQKNSSPAGYQLASLAIIFQYNEFFCYCVAVVVFPLPSSPGKGKEENISVLSATRMSVANGR